MIHPNHIDVERIKSLSADWLKQLWRQVYEQLYLPVPQGFRLTKENFDWIKQQTWNRYMRHMDVSKYWLWLIVGFVAVGLLLWIFAQTETLSLIGQIAFYVGLGDIPVRFLYNEITEYSDLYAMMMLELIERQPVPFRYADEDEEEEDSCIVR